MTQEPHRITMDPMPPTAGSTAEVCYDFDGATSPVTLTVTWSPSSLGTSTIEVTSTAACQDLDIPDGATAYIIEDESGQSAALGGSVNQPGG